jgi:RNA polymerase sigma-54 factor
MLKPSLQLRLSQQLTMTPQLQQAIRLLQLPVMELQTQIQEALDQNVMLEIDEVATADAEASTPLDGDTPDVHELDTAGDPADDYAEATVSESEWEDVQRTGPSEAPRSNEPRTTFEYADRSNETLGDHLLWQLELERFDEHSRAIGEAIIDAINDDGYLVDALDVIQQTLAPDVIASIDEIEAVLARVQRFDPVGCGARSVSECVLLQLEQFDPATPGLELARAITAEYLELVAEQQYGALKRMLKATDGDLEAALGLVRSCHPRPGSSVHAPAAEYVVPDVFVRRSDGHWVVELNGAIAPQLRVNQVYASSLGRGDEYDVLRTQLQEARWLIRSLEIRNETLLKVAITIVQRQTEFLEKGEEYMRPMVLRDVAEAIQMHESTVSRVTTGKYMHTPRGVFEFRYFFSSHLSSDDGEQSSTAVRAKIRKLVAAEDPEKPLSDNQIARILSNEGIKVARRTIAKYREALSIPSSSDRKRSKLAG